jgi:SAM-dependent methyltransferase
MTPGEEKYALRGGQEGYDRLLLLARDRWPTTQALFQRAGLAPGMRTLDLGCGGGEVSLRIAELVQPGGSVVGVDMDPVKLELARAEARRRGLTNVEFRRSLANEWNEPASYDAVFSRFLLQHLRDPVGVLRRMWEGVRPGGLLIVEDADHEGWCCDPPNPGFEFHCRMLREVISAGGGDPTVGRRLLRHFRTAGIPDPVLTVEQPVRRGGDPRSLLVATVEMIRGSILEHDLARKEEIDAAVQSLTEYMGDPQSMVSGPRVFQLWARRGGA